MAKTELVLGTCKCGLGALGDHLSLLLRKRCVNVKGKFFAIFAQRGNHEVDPMLHESADEVHVARQTVEPGYYQGEREDLASLIAVASLGRTSRASAPAPV